ncbi:AraC family transcriptional regulator [uncultured Salegentibacter sp.]|uniref:helix-turn-helix domain-containing protein n=1 Tax=Flavobacteriaceae TaxID=49546 RepID=UPI0030D94619
MECVKEFIDYYKLTLSEIVFKLDYSSVAYLSNQFKKVMGIAPTQFKKSVDKHRKSLDEI